MESEMQHGMITQALISSWKESLAIVGHAVCVHHQCRLCFLSLAGMVSHHKSCSGWSSPADYIPCTHCGARFKLFRSIQTHTEKCHNSLFGNTSGTSQSSVDTRSWCSPPPPALPTTPDIVPRPAASSPAVGPSSSSSSQQRSEDMPMSEAEPGWRPRQPSSHSQQSQSSSLYSVREDQLAEKEVQLSELENLVRQAEMKAEQTRKEKELSEWELSLQLRELECKRRLEAANKILSDASSSSPRSIQSPEPTTSQFPEMGSPTVHSTPVSRGAPRMQMFGQPRQPIVLPSTTKLPPSAIRLSSSAMSLINSRGGTIPGPSSLFSDDAPMNLCKPRTSITSETSEESIVPHNMSSASSYSEIPPLSDPIQAPIEIPKTHDEPAPNINIVQLPPAFADSSDDQDAACPCVDTSKDKVFDFCVKVVDDTRSSIEAGDNVKVSYPTTDNGDQIVLGDNIVLEEFLQNSGSGTSEVTFVAEEGPNGQITLIPQDNSFFQEQNSNEKVGDNATKEPDCEHAVETLEAEFENVRKDIEEINSPRRPKEPCVKFNGGCDVNYFENRVKDFEQKITGENDETLTITTSILVPTKTHENSSKKRNAEESIVSECKKFKKIVQKQPESLKSKSTSNKQLPVVSKDSVFSCGRCTSVLQSERSWKRHRDTVHGGSARLKQDPQGQSFTADQEDTAWRQALKAFKKIHCPRCNKTMFVDHKVLEVHLKDCSKDCNLNAGPVDRENNTASQNTKKQPKSKSIDVMKDPQVVASVNIGGERNKRRAATKARSTVAAYVKAMKTKIDGDSSDGDQDMMAGADEDSDENFNFSSEISINNFYKLFKVGKKSNYQCSLCSTSTKRKVDIEAHVMAAHKDKLTEDIDDDEDIDDSDESSEISTDLDLEDDDSVYGDSKSKRKKSDSATLRKLILEPCVDAVNLEKKFREKCYTEDKLSVCLSNNIRSWSKCDVSTRRSRSVGVSVRDLQSDQIGNVLHLENLKGNYVNKSHVMFCGGSVNSLAWCNSNTTSDQLLAVAIKENFQASKLGDTAAFERKSVIQFWSIPPSSPPSFLFGLKHNFGNTWCLEWCPSSQGSSCLGLLAAGCSDGSVRIWSVPDVASLERGLVYTGDADLSLASGDHGQCVSVSWYRGPGHQYLAASHVSGMVSVWHLTTSSPLLRQGTTLLPVQTWLAHHGNVTGVSLCPGVDTEPRYMVTGGSDRCYRFWDLRDTSVPLQEHKKGLVSDVAWVNNWSGAGVSYDDVYLQSHTQSLLAETGYHGTRSQPVISQNSCVTSMTVSQWLGCMAVCTSAGELIIFVMPTLDRSLEHDKNLAQRRCYVYRTEMLTEPELLDIDLRDYATAAEHCKLVYHDSGIHHSNKTTCPGEEIRRVRSSDSMASEDLTKYPLSGLTSVSWNNNPGHHNMLASAGHAGIVRVHNVAALNTPSIKQVFPSNLSNSL